MKYSLYILFFTTLVCCRPAVKESKTPYFEGIVEFAANYQVYDEKYMARVKISSGSRAVNYIGKGGFFCREYIDSNNIIVNREVYRPDSMRFYEIPARGDSMYSTDVTRPTFAWGYIGISRNSGYKILKHNVDIVRSKTKMGDSKGGPGFYIYSTYYNDTNYPIDPLTYKHAVFEGVEELFSGSPYLTTGMGFQYGDKGTVMYTATRIVPSHIDAWHFDIPKNKVIVE